MLIISTTAILLFRDVISKGAGALLDSYTAAYAYEKDSAYQALYQKYYDSAEAEYHVQNRASIRIGNISETGKLEVLKVSDVELIIDDSDLFEGGITSWLEVPGEGTYVVDLEAAEFVVDNDRIPNSQMYRLIIQMLTRYSSKTMFSTAATSKARSLQGNN